MDDKWALHLTTGVSTRLYQYAVLEELASSLLQAVQRQ